MQDVKRAVDSSVAVDAPSNISSADQNAVSAKPQHLLFPIEIWERIVLLLLPEIRPEEHIHPQPNGKYLRDRAFFWPEHQRTLKALALTCKRLKALALPALRYAPFLQGERVNEFVRSICQNERRRLVPDSSEAASTIRALHVQSEMFDMHIHSYAGYEKSFQQSFCTCDVHVLFSLAGNVRYISLECLDGRECEVCFQLHPFERARNHILAHFLSSTTVCRPLALRWIFNSGQKKKLSLEDAASYEPLSQLTSLELLNVSPPEELIAFLTGDLASAKQFPEVQEAISAGFSPNRKLQRLRLTTPCTGFLSYFKKYIEELAASAAGDYFDPFFSLPDYDEEYETMTRLHELASKSWMLPNLRLLIIEIPGRGGLRSENVLKGLVERDVLQDLSGSFQREKPEYPDHAASKLSSLFHATKRTGKLINEPSLFHGIAVNLDEIDPEWRKELAEIDSFWRDEQLGKHALITLWNSSRVKRGLKETEIRIVAERQSLSFRDTFTGLDEGFFCQAESIAQVGTRSKKSAWQSPGSERAATDDDGVWADPDIFSLVDTMPWLSYHQHNEYGCCSWSGELPRDNDPTSSSDGIHSRVVLPALIKMDDKQLDELGRLRRNPSRRARNSTQEQGTETKRQRSGATTKTPAQIDLVKNLSLAGDSSNPAQHGCNHAASRLAEVVMLDPISDKANPGHDDMVCHPGSLAEGPGSLVTDWLSLPAEILQRIIEYLLPPFRPEDFVFPHPHCKSLHDHIPYRTCYKDDLLALAAVCRRLKDLTLPALFRAIDLPATGQRNKFVDLVCRNDEGLLVPKESQRAAWIRSLRVESEVVSNDDHHLGWYFCACDTHVLSHVATEVRFLSLDCADGRAYDYDFEERFGEHDDLGPVCHPLAHFLSTSTTFRPRSLRLSVRDFRGSEPASISLYGVSSFAPLSQVTHLEIANFLPRDDLLATLVGDPTLAHQSKMVQEDISAGHSPRLKLECLRLSCGNNDVLRGFGEYVAYRSALEERVRLPRAQQDAVPTPVEPDNS